MRKTMLESSLAGCSSNYQPRGYGLGTNTRGVLGLYIKQKRSEVSSWERSGQGSVWEGAGACHHKYRNFLPSVDTQQSREDSSVLSLACIIMNKLLTQAASERWFWHLKWDVGRSGSLSSRNAMLRYLSANPARCLNPFVFCALDGSCHVFFSWTHSTDFLCAR